MDIVLSNSSSTPIYAQITEQIKTLILQNTLPEGEALPSMRFLAKELRISLITTKRAYEELEREGFITTVAGKGSFVAPKNLELLREENLKEIEQLLGKVIVLSKRCNLSLEETKQILDTIYTEE